MTAQTAEPGLIRLSDAELDEASPREGHRALRHLCVAAIVLCALRAAEGFLPAIFRARLWEERALELSVGWLLPAALLGLGLGWWRRRRSWRLWDRLVVLAGTVQAGYWAWQAAQGTQTIITALCAAIAGLMLAIIYTRPSQRRYSQLQSLSFLLFLFGAWRQTTELYPALLGTTMALFVLSAVAEKAAPSRRAEAYVDSRFPGLPRTLLRGAALVALLGLTAWPIFLLLPRVGAERRTMVRGVLELYSERLEFDRPDPLESGVPPNQSRALRLRTGRLRLSTLVPPQPQGETLFAVQGPAARPWQAVVLARYDGRSWQTDPDATNEPVRMNLREGTAILTRQDGAARISDTMQTYQVHVLSDLGPNLLRPPGTLQVEIPRHYLYRDGRGNVYASPPLRPPLRYETRVPVGRRTAGPGTPREVDPIWLSLPELDPRLPALAESIAGEAESDREAIDLFVRYLRENCAYVRGEHRIPAEHEATAFFLLEERRGWCSHFASALAVLCRLRGIPARVITGYGPGHLSPITQTYSITDGDAHAWIQARPDGAPVWQRFDPTPPALSPLEQPLSPAAAPQDLVRRLETGLQQSRGWLRRQAAALRAELARRPQWLLLLVPVTGLFLWTRHRLRTRRRRERFRILWNQVCQGTPRAAARAAYTIAADCLERRGYGPEVYTAPGEYLERLQAERSPAAAAMGFIVQTYEMTAFGPQVSLRWDRSRLARSCETVLKRTRRWAWLPWRRTPVWQEELARHPYPERRAADRPG